ncbi:MAG TPA: hypothetical protein VGR48_00170 [Terriglobales bacterium]|nr:hypothetical protein [Terriglobales bacterium]
MEGSKSKLTELQFTILDGMADDWEDLEQLYLYANREWAEERKANVHYPHMLLQVRFLLRDIMGEMRNMLREGLIEAKVSNDKELAPLRRPIDFTAFYDYWFGPTAKGIEAWKTYSADKSRET